MLLCQLQSTGLVMHAATWFIHFLIGQTFVAAGNFSTTSPFERESDAVT